MTQRRRLVAVVLAVALSAAATACTTTDNEPDGPTSAATTAEVRGDGTLVLAGLLPRGDDGNDAAVQAQNAAIHLALDEINAAGGVNGTPVTVLDADLASPSLLTDLQAGGVDITIGTPPEDVAAQLASTAMLSLWTTPAPATQQASADPDQVVSMGTSKSLQVDALAQQLTQRQYAAVGLLASDDDAGRADAERLAKALETAGVGLATDPVFHDPSQGSYTVAVTKLKGGDPDAIVVLGDDEAAAAVTELDAQGLHGAAQSSEPQPMPVYLLGPSQSALSDLPSGSLAGATLVQAGAEPDPEFQQQVGAADPASLSGAAEAYDATVLAALAAVAGGDDDAAAVRNQLQAVTTGDATCTSFADCAGKLADGQQIAYVGRSGALRMNDGHRGAGQVAFTSFDGDNVAAETHYVTVPS